MKKQIRTGAGLIMLAMTIRVQKNISVIPEGEHAVTVVQAAESETFYGEKCVQLTLEDADKNVVKQKFPVVGYRDFDQKKDDKGRAIVNQSDDYLTDAERASGRYAKEANTGFALEIKDEKGNMLPEKKRVVSKLKSEAAAQILGRVYNAAGLDADTDVTVESIIGKALIGVFKRNEMATPEGFRQYTKMVSFRPMDVLATA